MSEPFVAEIRILPFTFAPRGWAQCDGQLMPISQNTALFSLLGTFYGGDGKSTFALPDLRGRVPMFWGSGPGLSQRVQAETGGSETVTLTVEQMPAHAHNTNVLTATASSTVPDNNLLAVAADDTYGPPGTKRMVAMDPTTVGIAGSGAPHNNLQPFLVFNFCIALQGIFPSRG